jgi:hypothetical protein
MNTKQIRKQAIALQLGDLFKGTCQYSPDTPASKGLIEPDIYALSELRHSLVYLASRHFCDDLHENDVLNVVEFCTRVGSRCGHVLSNGWTTGTWGTRISALNDILKVLAIPDGNLAPIGSRKTVYDIPCRITGYKVSSNWLEITYTPLDPEVKPWDACVHFSELEIL